MAILGSKDYKIGLIIARSQPFHNGHLRAITEALMYCDEVIFSIRDYDTAYFDYNIAQKVFRELMGGVVNKVSFFGITNDPSLGTPKHVIERTLKRLEEARYNIPTHFFTNSELWVEPAKELQLHTTRIATLADHNSDEIYSSFINGTDLWKQKVPHSVLETLESYIATKKRNTNN